MLTTAADASAAVMATGIARVGCEAGQRGGCGRCGGAEFGQFGAQAGSGERAAAPERSE